MSQLQLQPRLAAETNSTKPHRQTDAQLRRSPFTCTCLSVCLVVRQCRSVVVQAAEDLPKSVLSPSLAARARFCAHRLCRRRRSRRNISTTQHQPSSEPISIVDDDEPEMLILSGRLAHLRHHQRCCNMCFARPTARGLPSNDNASPFVQ